jgi:subtilisin family serine protease
MGLCSLFCLLSQLLGGAPEPRASDRPLVAVIDSGVARTPELAPLLVAEYDMAAARPRPAFAPRYDHGTMVATILARETGGKAGIVSFRIDHPAGCPAGVDTPPCQPDAAPIERAIRRATRLGVDAINLSLVLNDDPGIIDAIKDAARRGIPVAIAAGNEGHGHPDNLRLATAAFPWAVLVGALDESGAFWAGTNHPAPGLADYHYAWHPGVDLTTVAANGHTVSATGTSFATPIETARLLRARRPAIRLASR